MRKSLKRSFRPSGFRSFGTTLGLVLGLLLVSACQALALPADNLTTNPSFESGFTGWQKSANAGWSQASGTSPPDGTYALKVSSNAGNSSAYSVDDDGNTVSSTQAGFAYTAQGYFKAVNAATSGKPVGLVVREWTTGGSLVSSKEVLVTINNSTYTSGSVTYTAQNTGDRIDVQFYRPTSSGIVSTDAFWADAVSLTSSVLAASNLVSNPSMETSPVSNAWQPGNATISQVADSAAPDRANALNVAVTSTASSYSVDDNGNTVSSATSGAVYTGRAFAKGGAATTGNGKEVGLVIREWNYSTGALEHSEKRMVTLTSAYQPIEVHLTAWITGDHIDVQLYRPIAQIVTGDTFRADGVSLVAGLGTGPDSGTVDTAQGYDPFPFWGNTDCGPTTSNPSMDRYSWQPTGGDTHLQASGSPQGNASFRRLKLFSADDYEGNRCELGWNDSRYSPGPTYSEGDHKITYLSVRLGSDVPLDQYKSQAVMQMKQMQPGLDGSDPGQGISPVLELDAYHEDNPVAGQSAGPKWILLGVNTNIGNDNDDDVLWEAPAAATTWVRFKLDVHYASGLTGGVPAGTVQISADLNNDGDYSDTIGGGSEQSSTIHQFTLKKYQLQSGSITSHLRTGIYHDPTYNCASGCTVDIDNVQVVTP
jgi:hypothetical protein